MYVYMYMYTYIHVSILVILVSQYFTKWTLPYRNKSITHELRTYIRINKFQSSLDERESSKGENKFEK